jgi:hypothetical protein
MLLADNYIWKYTAILHWKSLSRNVRAVLPLMASVRMVGNPEIVAKVTGYNGFMH